MSFSAMAVANEFIELADGQPLSPMKLQKLVYYAHGWHLALTGRPLIREAIQAWQFGPVIPVLYRHFKAYGGSSIGAMARTFDPFTGEWGTPRLRQEGSPSEVQIAQKIILDVWKTYGRYSATKLSNATHLEGTPWSAIYSAGERELEIPDEVIRDYFDRLRPVGADV